MGGAGEVNSSMEYISFVTNIHHQNSLANKEASFPLVFIGHIRVVKLRGLQGLGSHIHMGTGEGGAAKVLAPHWGQLVAAGPLYLDHFFPPTRS